MIFNTVRVAKFGDLSNLKKHLENQDHDELKKWLQEYDIRNKNSKSSLNINQEFFQFLLYFLSSNCAIEQIKNKYLRQSFRFKLSCEKTLRDVIIPHIFGKLNESVERKIKIAHNVALIGDIWTTRTMLDFKGLAAALMNNNFER